MPTLGASKHSRGPESTNGTSQYPCGVCGGALAGKTEGVVAILAISGTI